MYMYIWSWLLFLPPHTLLFLFLASVQTTTSTVHALTTPPSSRQPPPTTTTLFDRFRPVCPATLSSIHRFDPQLLRIQQDDDEDENNNDESQSQSSGVEVVWAAVYRSSNNKPSVFVKDEFLQTMRLAVAAADDVVSSSSSSSSFDNNLVEINASSSAAARRSSAAANKNKNTNKEEIPVAVARLRRSTPSNNSNQRITNDDDCVWMIDSMRCILKKENMDPTCDGGSEHTEAIATAIDALLLHYLTQHVAVGRGQEKSTTRFHEAIRTKATLIAAPLFQMRGFVPVEELSPDMATHVSSLDACMEMYAARCASTTLSKSPGARQRALSIVSCLGQLNREHDLQKASSEQEKKKDDDNDGDEYDPWSGMKRFI